MAYTAEISRSNPSCFLFLIDQSASMEDPFGGSESARSKAHEVADAINRLLQNLVLRCAKEEGVRDYFHVGVIGYGIHVGPAFTGPLTGSQLAPISDIADNPAKLDTREKKVPDGAGGLVEQQIKFPIWFDPVASGGTPMCQAFDEGASIIERWLTEHPTCFPPTVINITDGEATDGDPSQSAEQVRQLASKDGNVLLFNLHLSSQNASAVEFPSDNQGLPDEFAGRLFRMSSLLPPHMQSNALQEGYEISEGARGFVFNAGLEQVIQFLDIGTRPSDLR